MMTRTASATRPARVGVDRRSRRVALRLRPAAQRGALSQITLAGHASDLTVAHFSRTAAAWRAASADIARCASGMRAADSDGFDFGFGEGVWRLAFSGWELIATATRDGRRRFGMPTPAPTPPSGGARAMIEE